MSFASGLLRTLNSIRGIAGHLGLHRFAVTLRVNQWDGGAPGIGTKTVTDLRLTVADGQNPKVEQLSNQDALLSGGLYSNQDMRIGPLTPPYFGGGIADATVDPNVTAGLELYFLITGPGLPSAGMWFARVRDDNTDLHTYEIVRATGITNP